VRNLREKDAAHLPYHLIRLHLGKGCEKIGMRERG
jgi:hypothetical protein